MSAYKIMIRNSPGWRRFEDCTLGVSVTSPNWQEEHFASILDFAAANFKTIRIDVTDALYRHNFMAQGLTLPEAEARANALGTSWLERHQGIIEACPVTPEVIRWGKWYESPDYPNVLDSCLSAYRASPILRHAIEIDVDEFFRRQGREPTDTERNHGRDYLLEEVAVLTLQARNRASLKLYPGNELQCLNVVRRGLVPEAPRSLEREQFAKVKFHSRGGLDATSALPAPARNSPHGSKQRGADQLALS